MKYSHKPFSSKLMLEAAHCQHNTSKNPHSKDLNQARFIIMHGDANLFYVSNQDDIHQDFAHKNRCLSYFTFEQISSLTLDKANFKRHCFYLGDIKDTPIYVISINNHQIKQLPLAQNQSNKTHEFADLRQIGRFVEDTEASIAAYARGLVHFHQNHRFCGRCGSEMKAKSSGVARQCMNVNCQHNVFCRIDPAIITLVTHTINGVEHCLLGHNHRFAEGFYSAIAGFVDLGETMEQAVAREVYEETAIEVDNIQYVASQPWPFPQSLMIGFYARAKTQDIQLLDGELADAKWFNAEQISEFGEMGKTEKPFMLPSQTSIAHFLIKNWLKKQNNIS